MNIEALKRLSLVDFLTFHYGLEFGISGQGYVCRSPFSADRQPSFFVRFVEGHWLFKDFSSGMGVPSSILCKESRGWPIFPRW